MVYVPVSKYPMKSHEPIVKNYVDTNYVPRPTQVRVNRPLNPPVMHRPQVETQLHYSPYANRNSQATVSVQQPTKTYSHRAINPQFGAQKVDEYLLHAQMPLSLGQTYILPHELHAAAQIDEPEFLT